MWLGPNERRAVLRSSTGAPFALKGPCSKKPSSLLSQQVLISTVKHQVSSKGSVSLD